MAKPIALHVALRDAREESRARACAIRRVRSKDSLRGLAAAVDFLESFGRHLHALERRRA